MWASINGPAVLCSLVFPVEVFVHSHDLKGAAGDLLIEKEHEGSSQHCLQQLGLQAFEQAPYAVLPVEKLNMLHFNHAPGHCYFKRPY